jgi:enoyl-CoA hydratase/carnithine racemase
MTGQALNQPGGLAVMLADGIARLRFTQPQTHNALSAATCTQLRYALDQIATDHSVRLVLLEGSGGSFASGANISELASLAEHPPQLRATYRLLRATQERLYALPQPTVAVIDGFCIGAGLSLAVACDLRLATPRSQFCAPPATMGLLYSNIEIARLVQLVGAARARDLLFTGRRLRADEAFAAGLVNRLSDEAQLDSCVAEIAASILAASSMSLRAFKRQIIALERAAAGSALADDCSAEDAFFAPDATEGLRAFLEKRKPVFPSNQIGDRTSQRKTESGS